VTDEQTMDEFLKQPMGSAPEPPLLPQGTCLFAVKQWSKGRKKFFGAETESDYIRLVLVPQAYESDADPDAVARIDLSKEVVFQDYEMNAKGKKAFDDLMVTIFGANTSGAGIGEYLATIAGKQLVGLVVHKMGTKPNEYGKIPINVNVTKLKGAQ
jgi:hypothetical protein